MTGERRAVPYRPSPTPVLVTDRPERVSVTALDRVNVLTGVCGLGAEVRVRAGTA